MEMDFGLPDAGKSAYGGRKSPHPPLTLELQASRTSGRAGAVGSPLFGGGKG